MAEWVLKGSLKGPQGDPGQDAQLPAGGTDGQVLTKTADGEAWQDAPEPDMTGMATFKSALDADALAKVGEGGQDEFAPELVIVPSDYDPSSEADPISFVAMGNGRDGSYLTLSGESNRFSFGSRTIKAITDDVSDGSQASLATAFAVKAYADAHGMPSVVPISQGGTGATTAEGAALMVFAHAPEASPTQAGVVKTLSDEDFCAYMGIEYNPEDWS